MRAILPPMPAPPDVEPTDDSVDGRHAPVTFKPRPSMAGSIEVYLGQWSIGELQQDGGRDQFEYIVRLPGLPAAWRRPVPLEAAKDRVVETVRQWIEATPIPQWLADRSRQAAGDRRLGSARQARP